MNGARPLRVVFITTEEPLVMPLFFERVLPGLHGQVVAVAIVSPIYKNSSWRRQARRFADAFGWRALAAESALFLFSKVADRVKRVTGVGRYHSVRSLARHYGVPVLRPADVNAPEFLDQVAASDPDLIVSVSCPQIFRTPLLDLPRLGCVNVHSALLPRYKGVLPTFWAMANDEQETGVTVHYMTPGIDGGDIIAQKRIPIVSSDTLHSLMRRCKEVAADLVMEAIDRFRWGSVLVTENRAGEGEYFSFPRREDVARFRALGRQIR